MEWFSSLFTKEKESVYITNEAIFHELKSKNSSRVSYLPFDKIDVLLLNKSGFGKKRITAVGELSFSTKYSVRKSEAEELKKIFEAHHPISEGKVYHQNIFSGVKQRKRVSLIFLEDRMVYDDVRVKKIH